MANDARSILLTAERVQEFAAWSGDRNPLHIDAAEARASVFRAPVAHPLLALVAADQAYPATAAAVGQCSRIDLKVHGAVRPGITYGLLVEEDPATDTVRTTITSEAGRPVQSAEWQLGRTEAAPGKANWLDSIEKKPSRLDKSKNRSPEDFFPGAKSLGVYPAADQSFLVQGALLSRSQERILGLCSYVLGMEMPGQRALLNRLQIDFYEAAVTAGEGALAFQVVVSSFDATSRVLELTLEVCGADGLMLARAEIATYVRAAAPASVDAVREVLRNLQPQRLAGRVAIVTGASRGLGADIASALSLSGCAVYAGCRIRDTRVEELERSLTAAGARIEFVLGDVGEREWVERVRHRLEERNEAVDLLVLNAAEAPVERLPGQGSLEGLEYIARNLRLVAQPLEYFLPALQATGGALVAISSGSFGNAAAGLSDFVALKRATESLLQGAQLQSESIGALIARPPRMQTACNDAPGLIENAIPPLEVAASIVRGIDEVLSQQELVILEDFPTLESAAVKPSTVPALPRLELVVSCSFTADPLLPGFDRWAAVSGRSAATTIAPYHQVLQQLLDPGSVLATAAGRQILFLRQIDWLRERSAAELADSASVRSFLDDLTNELITAFDSYQERATEQLYVFLCPWHHEDAALQSALAACEQRLTKHLETQPGIRLERTDNWHSTYGIAAEDVFDSLRDEIGHIPYQPPYYDFLAAVAIRVLHAETRRPVKVVVADCDNTLWDGVVGEAGSQGIRIGSQHIALQERLAALSRAGVLIALCSKNEEDDVWSVFNQRRNEMPLAREHIVGAAINWQPKSLNIQSLAGQLNLGLDSFLFLDDNPVECAEVRANCPEVLTLRWPGDAEEAQTFVDHVWELDVPSSTAEDRQRTEMYRQEFKRQAILENAQSFDDFITSLELKIDIRPLEESDTARASQLTLRTNQFNFTTRRRDEGEIRALIRDPDFQCRTVRVSDRFGEYGLVGLLIVDLAASVPRIDTFLLSCRVLGRGVEHAMLAAVGNLASRTGAEAVAVELFRTERNTPALDFFRSAVDPSLVAEATRRVGADVPTAALVNCTYEPTGGTAAAASAADERPLAEADKPSKRDREELIDATLHIALSSDPGQEKAVRPGHVDERSVEDTVLNTFARFLQQHPEHIRAVDQLEALGCDSLMIVEITVALSQHFPELPATLLFEHPNIASIVNALAEGDGDAPLAGRSGSPAQARRKRQGPQLIAVTGMAIRCGGASSLDQFEALLREGRDAVTQVREDARAFLGELGRGPYFASLIEDAARFDAEFFGVVPREATYMDPQVRHFLEVAWSAIEDAGLAGSRRDPNTGVYVGAMYGEYREKANAQARRDGSPLRSWEAFSLANRLSQFMGFTGPSLAIDTACSSSGTAIHMACKALAGGECDSAVVGGVNLVVDPDRFRQLSKLGIISSNGRCRPFGEEANGTVLGEGVGAVVLRRLEDAVAAGDQIYGLIRGSALSVGAGSVGFTAPNPVAQAAAIADAVADAEIDPRSISYVECHGTGTALGDPIEVRGIELSYGNRNLWHRDTEGEQRVALGSVKGNIGHLEAGAGVVSLIKVLLQLRARTLFPTLSSAKPNPTIPLDRLGYRVQQTCERWQPAELSANGRVMETPLRAGVSSFGVGGSNVHLIVEEYVAPEQPDTAPAAPEPEAVVLPLAAPGGAALATQATALRQALMERPPERLSDFCGSVATRRPAQKIRASVPAQNLEQMLAGLETLSKTERAHRPQALDGAQLIGLFSGQGSQYPGMGRELYRTSRVFRETVDECADYIDIHRDHPLRGVMLDTPVPETAELIHQTAYTQPLLFALEIGLFRHFRERGIEPDVVCGHSIGEIAALCAAGGITLSDGLRLIEARGRLMQALPGDCGMLATAMSEEAAGEFIALKTDRISLAAVNGPDNTVLAGCNAVLTEIATQLESRSIRTTALKVSHGFHSSQMEGMLEAYAGVVRTINFHEPAIPIVSCVSGSLLGQEPSTEAYWLQQVRQPVRFLQAIDSVTASGSGILLEYGPQPVLSGMAKRWLHSDRFRWVPTLRPRQPETLATAAAIGALYEAGLPIDWSRAFGTRTRPVVVPQYRFSDTRFWLDSAERSPSAASAAEPIPQAAREPASYYLQWIEKSPPESQADTTGNSFWLYETAEDTHTVSCTGEPMETGALSDVDSWARLAEMTEAGRISRVVLYFAMSSSAETDASLRDADLLRGRFESTVRALRLLVQSPSAVKLYVCTATASGALADYPAESPVDSALWAMCRTIALEHPENWGGVISRGAARTDAVAQIQQVMRAESADDQWLCGEDGRYFVPRLTPAPVALARGSVTIDEGSVCLVIGGQGAIGLAMAQWLFDRGARYIVLTGRTEELSEPARSLAARVTAAGGILEIQQLELSQPQAIARLFAQYREQGQHLGAVIHCAGVDDIEPVLDLTTEVVGRQLGAKVIGGAVLRQQLEQARPDLVVLNSSIAGVLGSQGRAVYGAANGYLDGLAGLLSRQSIRTISIQWGPWAGGGMAQADSLEELQRMGNYALRPLAAIACFERALLAGDTQVMVAAIDWSRYRAVFEMRKERPVLSRLGSDDSDTSKPETASGLPPWSEQLSRTPAEQQRPLLLELLRQEIAAVLGHEEYSDIECHQPFSDLGLDSLLAVEFAAVIQRGTGDCASSILFDHPSLELLADHLLTEFARQQASVSALPEKRHPQQNADICVRREDTAQILSKQIADVLGLQAPTQVNVNLPFSELGLDSLLMVELAARLEDALGLKIALQDLFGQDNAAAAAAYLEQLLPSDNSGATAVSSTDTIVTNRHRVLGFREGLEPSFTEFTRQAWPERDPALAAARYHWMFVESARRLDTDPAVWRIEVGSGLAAFQGAIPTQVKLGNRVRSLPWFVDSMVLPEYRKQAFGVRILMASREQFPFNLSLGQSDAMRAIQDRLNWKQVCPLTTYVLPLRPSEMLGTKIRRPLLPLLSAGAHLAYQARRLTRTRPCELRSVEVQRFDGRFDHLWDSLSLHFHCAVVRDASYLNWKYVAQPGQDFLRLAFEYPGGGLCGFAVVKFQDPNVAYPYRRATIVDFLAPVKDDAVIFAMLNEIRGCALDRGAGAVHFHLHHVALEKAVRRYGFFDRGVSRYFRIDVDQRVERESDIALKPEHWLINMGDSDIDRP